MDGKSRKSKQNSFYNLCQAFKQSPGFLQMARGTQIAWELELDFACRDDVLGKISVKEVRPSLIQGYLDGWHDKPGKQRNALTVFRALSKWAEVRDLLSRDITRGVEARGEIGGHLPWTDEQVESAIQLCRPWLVRIIELGAWTGQRGSDLIRMGWGDISINQGRPGIDVTQKKTGRQVWCPILPGLAKAMESWGERRPGPFCLNREGLPWTRTSLTDAWAKQRRRLPDHSELVLHGLRAHACVRFFRQGLNPKQIGTLVGMSTGMVERYTRLSQQRIDAVAAVIQLEGHFGNRAQKNDKAGLEGGS